MKAITLFTATMLLAMVSFGQVASQTDNTGSNGNSISNPGLGGQDLERPGKAWGLGGQDLERPGYSSDKDILELTSTQVSQVNSMISQVMSIVDIKKEHLNGKKNANGISIDIPIGINHPEEVLDLIIDGLGGILSNTQMSTLMARPTMNSGNPTAVLKLLEDEGIFVR